MSAECRAQTIAGCLQVLALSCALAFALGMPAPVAADQALDDYNLSVQLYRQNRWAFASESFRKFLKDYPEHEKHPFARLYLGLTLVNQADFKGAREELRGFIKDYPQNQNLPQAKYRVAECSYLLNDLAAAKTELQAYLKDHPQDPLGERAWPYLGDVLLRMNEPAAASTAFAEAVQRYPEGALIDDAQFGWAKALEAEQKFDEALAKYRQLVGGKGLRAAEAWFQIGSREFDAGRYAAAATAYRSLTEQFPASPLAADAHLNAGFALFRGGDFSTAIPEFERAARDADRELQANYWRALCLKSLSQFPEAIDALAALQTKATDGPYAEAITFQRGMCERLAGRSEAAQASLVSVVARFPQGEYADDALHFATEIAIEAGDLPTAKSRLDQFAQAFPKSGLRLYQELLAGRYELAIASTAKTDAPAEVVANHYAAAVNHFDKVLKESTLPRTQARARYYLALTRQLQGDHALSLQLMQPLVDAVLADPSDVEFADILVLQADCLLQVDKVIEATTAARTYLEKFPNGRQTARALSLLATALTRDGQVEMAWTPIDRLVAEFPEGPGTAPTLLKLAELADERSDWAAAKRLYAHLAQSGSGGEYQAFGLRGLAWAEFQQKEFAAAASAFGKLEAEFPTHRLAPEASYYRAESLREQGMLTEAAAAFGAVFAKLAPSEPAAAGAEQQGAFTFAYRAGLQAARTLRQQNNVETADRAYAAIVEKFPRPQHLDRLLDEWALLNYEAQRFDQADAIFRRIVQETPDSDLADNAKLSLAESDLIANRLDAARQAFEELRVSDKSDATVRERAHFQLLVLALEQRRWADVLQLGSDFKTAFPESVTLGYVDYATAEAVLAEPTTPPDRLEPLLVQLAAMMETLPPDSAAWAPRLWVLAAEAQFRLKRYDDIARTVADLKTRLPGAALTYQAEEVLGRALKQQAKFVEAREALERVVANEAAFRTETAAKSQFLIAETWFLQEKWKEAFLAYQKVYASYAYPEWQSAALLQSGKCDEQLGNLKDAIATYDRLIQEFPTSTHLDEARRLLAQAKLKTGSGS